MTTRATYYLARYYDRKAAYTLRGLNSKGRPRRRRPNLLASERAAHYRQANLAKWHRRSNRLTRAGLTTRGTNRKYNRLGAPANPVEIAWRTLRSEMPDPCHAEAWSEGGLAIGDNPKS